MDGKYCSLNEILEKLFRFTKTNNNSKNFDNIKLDLMQRIIRMSLDVPDDITRNDWILEIYNDIITFYNDIVAEFEDHDAMFVEELDKYVLDIPLTQNVIIMYCAAIWHVQTKTSQCK